MLCTLTSLFCSLFQVFGDLELELCMVEEKKTDLLPLFDFLCNTAIFMLFAIYKVNLHGKVRMDVPYILHRSGEKVC